MLCKNAFNKICPGSNLKMTPHLESKLKKWKKNYSTINDMMNTSEFAWNAVKKCIELDNNETCESYIKYHSCATKWRNKPYPIFDRLANIFGKNHANGKGTEVLSEMMKDIGSGECDDVNKQASPISINKESNYSRLNQGKRKRRSSNNGALMFILKEVKLVQKRWI
ncbi:hypothetical protein ACOSP7_003374 [Xanthoceras sorbifolium]